MLTIKEETQLAEIDEDDEDETLTVTLCGAFGRWANISVQQEVLSRL